MAFEVTTSFQNTSTIPIPGRAGGLGEAVNIGFLTARSCCFFLPDVSKQHTNYDEPFFGSWCNDHKP